MVGIKRRFEMKQVTISGKTIKVGIYEMNEKFYEDFPSFSILFRERIYPFNKSMRFFRIENIEKQREAVNLILSPFYTRFYIANNDNASPSDKERLEFFLKYIRYSSNQKMFKKEKGNIIYRCDKCLEFSNETTEVKDKKINNAIGGEIRSYRFCRNCFKIHQETISKCAICGEYWMTRSLSYFRNSSKQRYCPHCADKYMTCQRCLSLVKVCEVHLMDNDLSHVYCSECFYDLGNIYRYDYIPSFKFYKTTQDGKNPLYLGIELEVIHPRNYKLEAIRMGKWLEENHLKKYFYFKNDGSLRLDGKRKGFEIVSMPFTVKYAKKHLEFRKFLSKLKEMGFLSYTYGKCGLHIHASRSYYNIEDLRKLKLFFAYNFDEIVTFSKREDLTYCSIPPASLIEYKRLRTKNRPFYETTKYYAIRTDVSEKDTVEFRIFRGTLNYSRFWASILFVVAISKYVKETTFMANQLDCWKLFLDWLYKEDELQFLKKYLEEQRLSKSHSNEV